MNMIFVPDDFVTQNIYGSNSGLNISERHHQAFGGINAFSRFWNKIDSHEVSVFSITRNDLEVKFWDRFEFIDALHSKCNYDVYVKSDDYSIELAFLHPNDLHEFRTYFYSKKNLTQEFPMELKAVFEEWRRTNDLLSEVRLTVTYNPNRFIATFRDEDDYILAKTKFFNTKPEDHPELLEDDVPF